MGCSSQLSCLGPKMRERQVYQNLIQLIYRQVDQLPISQQFLALLSNQDQYQFIKNALSKKGLLRKLTDNLKSHKNNIYNCVDQNFQMASQSKQSHIRITSLIIVDKIMEEILKVHRIGEDTGIQRQNTELALSSRGSNNILEKSSSSVERGSFINLVGIDQRMDQIFLRQILYLLQNEKQIQDKIINSIILFCEYKEEKIVNKNQVYSIFEVLYKKMYKKQGNNRYLRAFELLLKKLKQNFKQEQKDAKYLKYFMNLQSKQESTKIEVALICQSILKTYLQKYFGDYAIFYKSMSELFDIWQFDSIRCVNLWQLMLNACRQQDSYANFIRGLFIFILRYIMVHQQLSSYSKLNYKLQQFTNNIYKNVYKEQCKLNAFRMVTQWIVNKYIDVDQTILYSSNLIVMAYLTNYLYGRSETIKQQLKKEFYKIISLLNGKSNQIIIQILVQQIRERQTLNKKRKMLVIVIKEILILKNMLNNIQDTTIANIFIMLEPYYSIEAKLQIISYMKFILKSIKSEYVNGTSYDSTGLRQRLCDFVYSLYLCITEDEQIGEETQIFIKNNLIRKSRISQDLNQSKIRIMQKNKFTAEMVSVIKILLEQRFYIIVVSFIQNVNEAMSILYEHGQENIYTSIYFIQLLKRLTLFSINKRQKIPEEIIKLHLKLEEGHISNAIKEEMKSIVLQLVDQYHLSQPLEENQKVNSSQQLKQKINILMKSDQKRIWAAKQFYMFNQLEYSQITQIFKQHFRLGNAIAKKESETLAQMKLFHRNSEINLSRQESDRSTQGIRHEQDESFRDIIAKISQR